MGNKKESKERERERAREMVMREKNVAEVGKRVGSEGRKGFFSCRLLSARFSAGRAQPPVACDSHFNSEPPGGP